MKISTLLLIVAAWYVLMCILASGSDEPPVYYKKKLLGNYNARTLPPFGIYIQEAHKGNAALLEHEKIHWQQYRRMGLIGFYLTYLYENAVYGYDCNSLEIEARANESEYCRQNYTECVRNGIAKTIHNPQFRLS